MKRPPQAIIILVILLCFALGLLNVFLKAPDRPGPDASLPSIPEEGSDAPIRSILILGVDNLGNEKPKIRAIWMAAFREFEQNIYLHGIRLDMPVPSKGNISLSELFGWRKASGIDKAFLAGLYEILPLQPDLTIIMDEVAFAQAIDYLQGVDIKGESFDGKGVLAFLSFSWEKPEVLLESQALIIQAIIPKALSQPESLELTQLVALLPDHAYLSVEVNQAIALITPLRKIDPDAIFLILLDGQ